MFVTFSYNYRPSLIFARKVGTLTLERGYVKGSTMIGSILVCKYRVEVTDSDIHSSLLRYGKYYIRKKSYKTVYDHYLFNSIVS